MTFDQLTVTVHEKPDVQISLIESANDRWFKSDSNPLSRQRTPYSRIISAKKKVRSKRATISV